MIARELTIRQLKEIRKRRDRGERQQSIADDYGLSTLTAALLLIEGMEYAGYFDKFSVRFFNLCVTFSIEGRSRRKEV